MDNLRFAKARDLTGDQCSYSAIGSLAQPPPQDRKPVTHRGKQTVFYAADGERRLRTHAHGRAECQGGIHEAYSRCRKIG